MFSEALRKNLSSITYIFFNSLLSGLVLISICSSFAFMLSEKGISISTITNILLATLPYSWKFVISPLTKNLITKFTTPKCNVLKIISFVTQAIIFLCLASLGYFENYNSFFTAGIIVFILVIAVSMHDIIRAYIKLSAFKTEDLGVISAIENTGFRIGMFIAGACIIYIANISSWSIAFISAACLVFLATFSTFFIKNEIISEKHSTKENLLKYLKSCKDFAKKYNITILILVIISFRFTDSCINVLKPMFMQYLGISRLAFANITHLLGTLSMIISGIVAGCLLYKIGSKKCIQLTFISQMISSLIFMYFAAFKTDLLTITILVNISTFIFGFSGVVFRTFAAENSQKDINIYTILLSFGSLIRISSYSFAGMIVENYSWGTIYFLCLLSNIPGYLLYLRLQKNI